MILGSPVGWRLASAQPTVGGVGQKTACLAVCGMILESVDAMTG